MSRRNLFFKKNYTNMLEQILDRKNFSSIAKSLLLSMLYRLEISYNDYEKINPNAAEKDLFFENMLDVINRYCDNVKTVEPNSIQAKILVDNNVEAVTNGKERSILTYPTENAILYAVSDVEPKYFYIKDNFIFKDTFQNILVYGYNRSNVEILKNFSGWSWEVNSSEIFNFTSNLIYKNIMLIMGEKFLYDWRKDKTAKRDYLAELKRYVKAVTGDDEFYNSLCKLLYISSKKPEKYRLELKKKEQQYKELINQSDDFIKAHVREYNKLKVYHQIYRCKNDAQDELLNLQKCFLKFMDKKISRIAESEELIKTIAEFRFYKNMVFSKDVLIKENAQLEKDIDSVMKKLVTKACKLGVIKIISMDIEKNFEIINYILDTKIINLEDIKIYLEIEEDNIFIKVYDKEIFEKETKIQFGGNKKDISIRKKRMVKLFN